MRGLLFHFNLSKTAILDKTHHYTKTKKICFLVCDFRGKLPTRNKQDFVIMPKKKNNYKKPKTLIDIVREFNSTLMVNIVLYCCLGCGAQRKCQTIRDSHSRLNGCYAKYKQRHLNYNSWFQGFAHFNTTQHPTLNLNLWSISRAMNIKYSRIF